MLERWRDTETGRHLEKIASWQPEVDDETTLAQEFAGALAELERQQLESRYDHLLTRSNQGDLSPEEKRELKQLFSRLNRDKRLDDVKNRD